MLLLFAENDAEMFDDACQATCLECQCEIYQKYRPKVATHHSNWNWLVAARSNTMELFAQVWISR